MLNSPIMNLFGRSPIRPLEKHMDKVHACTQMLLPFIEAVFAQDWTLAESLQLQISDLEHEADELKRDLRIHLPNGLFLPVKRGDILRLLQDQDNIANNAEDIAGLIVGRQMQFPASIAEDYKHFLQRCIDASAQADNAINELDELLETGFHGNEVTLVEAMINELNAIEQDTDEMQRKIRKKIFALEKTLPPIDVIFLYKIIDRTGDLADYAQRVGGQLLILVAR